MPASPGSSCPPLRTWGEGDRTVLLVHGLSSASTSFVRLGPALAARGYRVLAPDLPGHGRSSRLESYTLGAEADALAAAAPGPYTVAVGHSLGGRLLFMARDRIRAARYVYLDPAWGPAPDESVAAGLRAQTRWDLDTLAAANPRWHPDALAAKLAALRRWDTATLDASLGSPGVTPEPADAPSLVLLADPSLTVPDALARRLPGLGYTVRTVPGAGHVLHHDDLDGTLRGMADWL
ncbi:alpha/beta fold hydrolase [Streptomyces sp. NPDC050560]|uniref:alpha/beta fold hydrolase n=1 Tax=Streptomyces sp. NPDC050560 TaxID=3365630 RepID=UPI0037A36F6C